MEGYEIIEKLKEIINNEEHNKYINKIIFDNQNSTTNNLIFITDNIFIANWARRNYTEKIMQILKKHNNNTKIEFKTKTQIISKSNTTKKKYIIENNQNFINPEYSFENFILGECNKFAYGVAKEVATQKAKWNPLLIYGNTGLGKTHLLNAICHEIYKKNPNANIIFITAETMFNEYRYRITKKTMDHFRERFRKCDYLIIDDVQFLANTDKFQEEFFNTFNEIIKNNGKIIMSSDKAPKLIDKLEKRLKSRFDGGMMAKIESPELETKINIIKQKCSLNGINLNLEIINLLATSIQDNIREIEGIIISLYGRTYIYNTPITIEIVKNIIKERELEKNNINFDDIIKIVAVEYNIKPNEIKTKTRGKKIISKSRKIVAYIAREELKITFPYIASELNLKDHSAVSKQIKSITQEMQKDNNLKNEIQNLISKLKKK